MSIFSRFFKFAISSGSSGTDTITIEIKPELYYKELAIHESASLIGNAIANCDFRCYAKNEEVKNEDFYNLNISPNPNQTATQFWHKVIEKTLALDGEALAFTRNNNLYCADSFVISEQRDIIGHKFGSVTLGNMNINGAFNANNSIYFKMDSDLVADLIDGINDDYSSLIKSAVATIKRNNAKRYKLHINAEKAGDKDFNETFTNIIQKQIKSYMENDNAVYPEFDGYELSPDTSSSSGASINDLIAIRKDMFEMVAGAYKIPLTLLTGESRTMKDVMDSFMTFAVDPVAKMIEQALNKWLGYTLWSQGYRYEVDTSRVYHRDIFDLATDVDKLIASGFLSIDEAREKVDLPLLNTSWSQQHFMTKNYGTVDEVLNSTEGGE